MFDARVRCSSPAVAWTDPALPVTIRPRVAGTVAAVTDEELMGLALEEARAAEAAGEVPVGSVVVAS